MRNVPRRKNCRRSQPGKPRAAVHKRMSSHLEICTACRTVVQSLPSVNGAEASLCVKFAESSTLAPNTVAPLVSPPSREVASLHAATIPIRHSPAPDENYSYLHAPVEPDEIGRLGNYRVLRLIGKGGMGMVFLAEDLRLRRQVALKVMRPEMHGDRDSWERFWREAKAMAALKHDHLVTIYEQGQEGDVVFFAMELLDGELLEQWMKRVPTPDAAEIIRIGKELADGLACLHKKLIHRDIKPANIWLEGSRRRVKILDFGLARNVADDHKLTVTGIVMGTPEYMSPEQARGDVADVRTDLFSLGCVLYCLCTSRKPFQGNSITAVLMALASETPPTPRSLNPRISASLSALVMQLLERNPNHRPASAEVVLRRLTDLEIGQQIQPDRATSAAPKRARRTMSKAATTSLKRISRFALIVAVLAAAGLFAVLALLAACLIGAFHLSSLAPPPPPGPPGSTFLVDLPEIRREHWPLKKPEEADPGKEPKKKTGFKDKDDFKDKGPPRDIDLNALQGRDATQGIFMHPPVPPLKKTRPV